MAHDSPTNRMAPRSDSSAAGDRPQPARASRPGAAWRSSRKLWLALGIVALVPLVLLAHANLTYPSDRTPEGAYLRVVKAVNRGAPDEFFAYIEEEAQHACFTIRDYRKRALKRARRSFPEEALQKIEAEYGPHARAADGAEVFAIEARRAGWLTQLRADLSGIDHVEVAGVRATVETVRGTRYAFRKRPGGIWGMTAFTPALVAEAERASRDLSLIDKAAEDYERSARVGQ